MPPMNRGLALCLLLLSLPLCAATAQPERPTCQMRLSQDAIALPDRGVQWTDAAPRSGPCPAVPDSAWTRRPLNDSLDVMVAAQGPSGSGRFWTVTMGLAPTDANRPTRGRCLRTSTDGFQALPAAAVAPLTWLQDRDADGTPEITLWGAFALTAEHHPPPIALTAWVYDVSADGAFPVNWHLSRTMADTLARAYRRADASSATMATTQTQAARQLEAFASWQCAVPAP